MPVYGDVREDGFIFRGYHKRGDKLYPHWESPERSERRTKSQSEWMRRKREEVRNDPEALEAYRSRHREYEHKKRRTKIVPVMLARARLRARNRGLDFSLVASDISIPDVCPVLGIALRVSDGVASDSSPELDRIDNSLGYIRGNVIVVSRRANRIKNNATVDELVAVASFYSELTSRPR